MIVESKFSPTWWLSNPHLQTILASKVFSPTPNPTRSERIEHPDGDFLDINVSLKEQGDIVAIFHGLAGCVDSSYVQGAFASLEAVGFRPVLMHWRGCSGEPNRKVRSYHSGASEDIEWFIGYLSKRFPENKLFALGFSLGGNALLKHLGEAGSASPLSGAMAISAPLVLQEGANKMSRGFARLYQHYLLSLMRHQHESKRRRYPELNLPRAGKELNSFWRFDDAITSPTHGFAGVEDYYERCSARQFLPAIRVPTHLLCAKDDPFFTPDILPGDDELADDTVLELSDKGGHVGFLGKHSNRAANNRRWLDQHIATIMANFRNAVS